MDDRQQPLREGHWLIAEIIEMLREQNSLAPKVRLPVRLGMDAWAQPGPLLMTKVVNAIADFPAEVSTSPVWYLVRQMIAAVFIILGHGEDIFRHLHGVDDPARFVTDRRPLRSQSYHPVTLLGNTTDRRLADRESANSPIGVGSCAIVVSEAIGVQGHND
jgi:hypothetical protein